MPKEFNISRRKALAALGTIGVASAGAGVGTTAYFSDTESFANNELTAGELDLFVDYATSVDQGGASVADTNAGSGEIDGENSTIDGSGTLSGEGAVSGEYNISDVKPGDSGYLKFCPKIVNNPAWLWVGAEDVSESENGRTEPEAEVDSSSSRGELAESIQVDVYYCESSISMPIEDAENNSNVRELNNPDDYTLEDLLLELQTGFPIDGDQPSGNEDLTPYPGSADSSTQNGPCLCIEWEVPTDVGNEIQTDSAAFDIVFKAVQERHNPNTKSPFSTSGFSSISFENRLNAQILKRSGNGTAEMEFHAASAGATDTSIFGSSIGDTIPTDVDHPFTVKIDADNEVATVSIDNTTLTENDISDGTANGDPSGARPEYPDGVPDSIDVAVNASSGGPDATTIIKDVKVDGTAPYPDSVSISDGVSWLAIPNADASDGTVTVEGKLRFEGTGGGTSNWAGIDFR